MERLEPQHWKKLRDWVLPERPGALVASHALATGLGQWWVDRWPHARCALVFVGGNFAFAGDASAFVPRDFARITDDLLESWDRVFLDPPDSFASAVREVLPKHLLWPRVVYAPMADAPPNAEMRPEQVRRLTRADSAALAALDPDIHWIADTRGGLGALAASESAFGAWVEERLVSVAAPFFVGEQFEELAVVTEPEHRRAGWSTACAAALIADVRARKRSPCWSTTPDNLASRRVAEKLGLARIADELHLVVGDPLEGALPPGSV